MMVRSKLPPPKRPHEVGAWLPPAPLPTRDVFTTDGLGRLGLCLAAVLVGALIGWLA